LPKQEKAVVSFRVRVVSDEGRISGAVVALGFTSWTAGGVTDGEYTDDNGYAYFDCRGRDGDEIIVYVYGDNCGTYTYYDGESITIEI